MEDNLSDFEIDKVYGHQINGISLETGDLICTVDGNPWFLIGQFWWFVGRLIPGDVDHIVTYIGPEGRCVEAGAKGRVITFKVPEPNWDALTMFEERNARPESEGRSQPLDSRRTMTPIVAAVTSVPRKETSLPAINVGPRIGTKGTMSR